MTVCRPPRFSLLLATLCALRAGDLRAEEVEDAKEAEEVEEAGWKLDDQYGLKLGLNFAELSGADALPESDRKVGYSFGLYGSFKLSSRLKLQPEVIWSLQGEDSKSSGRYKISYLNFPLMLKWLEKPFYAELGPQFGVLTINTSESVPQELQLDELERYELSVNVGGGVSIWNDWTLGLRYIQGLTTLVRGRDLRNSVIYVGISYRLL